MIKNNIEVATKVKYIGRNNSGLACGEDLNYKFLCKSYQKQDGVVN